MKRRCWAEVSFKKLNSNLKNLTSLSKSKYEEFKGVLCMVKSNAYGHGLVEVSRELDSNACALGFGVASFDEALMLREAGIEKPVWIFSDFMPLTEEDLRMCRANRFTIVIHTIEDLKKILNLKSRPEFHLKFNTGLTRLGIDLSSASKVLSLLKQYRAIPGGICSHMSDSDLSGSFSAKITKNQVVDFKNLVKDFGVYAGTYIHMSNSGGLFSETKLGLGKVCNVIRPGIGLYGYGHSLLKPVLTLKAKVLMSRILKKGECVGYGSTFIAKKTMHQNVLSLGYGDGFHRILSGKNILISNNSKENLKQTLILGRVSMDLISIEGKLKVGDEVTLLGQTAKQGIFMAEQAQTIIYELLTSISSRVPRIYSNI